MNDLYIYFLKTIVSWQSILNATISDSIEKTQNAQIEPFLIVLGIAFSYGLIHAAGPGHAKTLIASYMIQRGWSGAKKAALLGFSVSAVHTLSALILTFGIYFLMERFSSNFTQSSAFLQKSSAILIILVGFYLLYEAFTNRKSTESSGAKDFFAILAAGLVPCPGVMTITLFSLTLGHYTLALLSAVFMSLGMGMTIFISALLSGFIRQKSLYLFPKWEPLYSIIGAVVVIALGILLANISFTEASIRRPY